MNLKKFFVTAAAVVFSTGMIFAQEADKEMMEKFEHTQQAISASLTIYNAHKATNSLTDTDRAIETALNTTLPAIFNQVENPREDLGTEMENAVTSLANTLLTYQELYPANLLDQDIANLITVQLAVTYAAQNELITPEVATILLAGFLEALGGEEAAE